LIPPSHLLHPKNKSEFLAKIYFPKFRKYFEIEEALEFLKSFLKRAELTDIKTTITICRDPKDNFFLALSKDAGVGFLITGGKYLLEIKNFENTTICTLSDFIKNHFNK
jgi:putative PIN family toxin of toxin-antitoxin system